MTSEKKEYIHILGLDEISDNAAENTDKQTALRYVMSGSPIPQTLLFRLDNYRNKQPVNIRL